MLACAHAPQRDLLPALPRSRAGVVDGPMNSALAF
jgi:hypothetical protein